jgi:hypothetical protein
MAKAPMTVIATAPAPANDPRRTRLLGKVRQLLSGLAVLGYEDRQGFHFGAEARLGAAPASLPLTPQPVQTHTATAQMPDFVPFDDTQTPDFFDEQGI